MTTQHCFKLNKLIRDNLPSIVRAKNAEIFEYVMEVDEYILRLKDKLVEEAQEVVNATCDDELIEELADVLEVFDSLSKATGISRAQIEQRQLEKRMKNGGFDKRLYASHIKIDADHEDIGYYLANKEKYSDIALTPRIGIGVLIFNERNQVLLGKRINAHGDGSWGPPGGHLEFRESFEECAVREVMEEVGIRIQDPEFLACTNDVFITEQKHYVSIFMKAYLYQELQIQNLEPNKIAEWGWFDLVSLPEPLFLPLQQLIAQKAYYRI